eukprot:scaffold116_cov220-Alexandrium_tamarense.AAC.15
MSWAISYSPWAVVGVVAASQARRISYGSVLTTWVHLKDCVQCGHYLHTTNTQPLKHMHLLPCRDLHSLNDSVAYHLVIV